MMEARHALIDVSEPTHSANAFVAEVGRQAELFTLDQVAGYGGLSRRERTFAEAIFSGCNQTEAARRAGVVGGESNVRAAGAKLAAKPSVRAVMYQAWSKSGASIDDTVRQAAAIAERAFIEWQHGETAERRAAARSEWREAAALLASIHGRLGIRVEGSINHLHSGGVAAFTLPPSALPVLAQMRRDVVAPQGDVERRGTTTENHP